MMGKRVALITGASGTLGTALCQRLAPSTDIAATWFRRRPRVASQDQQVVDPVSPNEPLPENQFPVHLVRANVANLESIPELVEQVLKRFGRIDIVVNAAAFTDWSPLLNGGTLLRSFDRSFRVNVRAPLAVASEVARQHWIPASTGDSASAGRVINISSTAAINVYRGTGQSVYAASKAALNHLTNHMASEFAAIGVRVNALAPNTFPGVVSTESVMEGVETLMEADYTGKILVLDADGWSWI